MSYKKYLSVVNKKHNKETLINWLMFNYDFCENEAIIKANIMMNDREFEKYLFVEL